MPILYDFPGATCGAKARLTLLEKGVAFDHRMLDRDGGDLASDWYRRLNPSGVVPTLVLDDGGVLTESSVIMVFADEAFEGPPLRPAGALGHARTALWLKQVDDLLPALGTLSYAVYVRDTVLRKSPAALAAYYAAIPDPVRRERRRSVVERGLDAPEIGPAVAAFAGLFARVDAALDDGRDWLLGPFSLADIALAPFVFRLQAMTLDLFWSEARPAVGRWWRRLAGREACRTVFASVSGERLDLMAGAGRRAAPRLRSLLASVVAGGPGRFTPPG